MGNRMNAMQASKRSSSATPRPSKDATFIPILPFSKPSDLAALYILGAELGRGQFGTIRACTSRSSGALFACKSISKLHLRSICDVEDVVREVRIMKHLCSSPKSCVTGGIIHLHDVVEDQASVHLIMELCSGGELFERITKKKCYPEDQAALIMKSLLEAVQFCHSMGIMHCDIKPENILLVEDSDTSPIKLVDFGLALEFSPGEKFSGVAGSSYYMAPEVFQGEYSEEIDMWSAGVILYILLSGVPPFWGPTEQRIFHAIQKGELSFPASPWDGISASAKQMITQMLHPHAKSRLTPTQALQHPWIVHHTKNVRRIDLDEPSSIRPSPMSLEPKENGRSLCASLSSIGHTQILPVAGIKNTVKPELNKVFVDVIACMSKSMLSTSGSLAASGWKCTVLGQSGREERLVVEMGQDKYLVSHDRQRKRIGWKLLNGTSLRSVVC